MATMDGYIDDVLKKYGHTAQKKSFLRTNISPSTMDTNNKWHTLKMIVLNWTTKESIESRAS